MLETIRDKLMNWFAKRREEGLKMEDRMREFVPKVSRLRLNHADSRLPRPSVN
jgi:hypothetical protein